jgi:GT2 family glycosyltransferase
VYSIRIIIVNYKTSALVQDCLRSIEKEKISKANLDVQVVVVDNDSRDNSTTALTNFCIENNRKSWISLLESKKNLGFGAGNNLGYNFFKNNNNVSNAYVLILNPDLRFVSANLEGLVNFINSNEKIGVLGPVLIGTDQKAQSSGFRFPSPLVEFVSNLGLGLVTKLFKNSEIALSPTEIPRKVDWISGAAMFFKPGAYEQLSGFDEGFFLYFEEVDLCYRMKSMGLEVWQYPTSIMLHHVGASTGFSTKDANTRRRPLYWFFSRKYFYEKNFGFAYRVLCDFSWLIGFLLNKIKNTILFRQNDQPRLLAFDFFLYSLGIKKWKDPRS